MNLIPQFGFSVGNLEFLLVIFGGFSLMLLLSCLCVTRCINKRAKDKAEILTNEGSLNNLYNSLLLDEMKCSPSALVKDV